MRRFGVQAGSREVGLPRWGWWVVLVVGLGLALRAGTIGLVLTAPVGQFGQDFAQEYLLGRAILDGFNPYLPMGLLAAQYHIPGWEGTLNPTPHAAPVGLVFLQLAGLDYATASVAWIRLQVVFVGLTALLLLRATRQPWSLLPFVALTMLFLGLEPFSQDLQTGNLTVLLLVLLASGRLAMLSGRRSLAGALFGLSILVKPVPWPLLVLLAIRRDWRAWWSACGVIATGYMASLAIFGPGRLLDYFLHVLPNNNGIFATSVWNISLWTIAPRLFEGAGGKAGVEVLRTLPLINYPSAAPLTGALLPILVLVGACLWARKVPDFDEAFGVQVCVLVLISPVAWDFYLTLAALPAAVLATRLDDVRASPRLRLAALSPFLVLVVPLGTFWKLGQVALGHSWSDIATWVPLPFGLGLLVLAPAASLALVAGLLATLGSNATDVPRWAQRWTGIARGRQLQTEPRATPAHLGAEARSLASSSQE